ncbi:MAG: recombinase family protein [Parvibaculum sp.]|uniref:recombinase family protein n=1 Tax=Parvibaculum sp. TaxID=2024848 RepID=UPI003C713EC4
MMTAQKRFIPYARVSTEKQGRSGLGLEAQLRDIEGLASSRGWLVVHEPFVDVESGAKDEREGLRDALALCRDTGATLIVAKLDRLSRDVAFGATLLKDAEREGVRIVSADMPEADTLMLHIRLAVAEEERRMISRRTKSALQSAKARGVKLGGRREGAHNFSDDDRAKATEARAATLTRKARRGAYVYRPIIEELRAAGIRSNTALAQALNERGITSPRGGKWQATSVRRLLDMLTLDGPSRHAAAI